VVKRYEKSLLRGEFSKKISRKERKEKNFSGFLWEKLKKFRKPKIRSKSETTSENSGPRTKPRRS